MFRTVPLSIIRSFPLYTQQWCMSYRFVDRLRAGSGWNLFGSAAVCDTGLLTACEQGQDGTGLVLLQYVVEIC